MTNTIADQSGAKLICIKQTEFIESGLGEVQRIVPLGSFSPDLVKSIGHVSVRTSCSCVRATVSELMASSGLMFVAALKLDSGTPVDFPVTSVVTLEIEIDNQVLISIELTLHFYKADHLVEINADG